MNEVSNSTLNKELKAIQFSQIHLDGLDGRIVDSFADLPMDPYFPQGFRFRRFSQYQAESISQDWEIRTLPPRPYFQSEMDNRVAGGILREFESLVIQPTSIISAGLNALGLDTDETWQVDVHQWRIVTDDTTVGLSVPEGPHQDGHMYSMIAVIDRVNISGGETSLLNLVTEEKFHSVEIQPMEAIVFNDRLIKHNASNIAAPSGEKGHRDLFLLAFNTWSERKYGDEYEARIRTSLVTKVKGAPHGRD